MHSNNPPKSCSAGKRPFNHSTHVTSRPPPFHMPTPPHPLLQTQPAASVPRIPPGPSHASVPENALNLGTRLQLRGRDWCSDL